MADAIPVADPGLLAAQAKAGQAGVDAYNAAISQLQQQKQQAVQGAMQEAAMRGSPQGAAQSQSGIIATPYDQRIASLTQGLGSFQADQAARTTRMNDYNQAVQGARSYIPQQTEQIVAPIRAQGEYNVRNTEMQGQMRVSELEGENRLTLARMAAAFQAAQLAAAKKAAEKAGEANKLNQGELQSMLSAGAMERVGNVGEQVTSLIEQNSAAAVSEGQTALRDTFAAGQAQLTPAQRAQQDRDNQFAETAFARGRGQGLNQSQMQSVMAQAARQAARVPGTSRVGGIPNSTWTKAPTDDPWAVGNSGRFMGAPSSPDRLAAQIAEQRAERSRIAQETNQQSQSALQNAMGKYRSQYGYITGDQLSAMDPLDASFVTNAPAFLSNAGNVDRYLLGAPYQSNSFQGESDPYSMQVMRDALGASADDLLAQGYEFDRPQFLNAVSGQGSSFYNRWAEENGQPDTGEAFERQQAAAKLARDVAEQQQSDIEDRQNAAEDEEEDYWGDLWNDRRDAEWMATHDPETGAPLPTSASGRAEASAGAAASEQNASNWWQTNYQIQPPSSVGTAVQAQQIAQSEGFDSAKENILADANYNEKGYLTPKEFDKAVQALAGSGLVLSSGQRRLLRHIFVYEETD